ncbi:MAG: 5'/3'-nucleotidase SurE [Actinobacteria bacterium]|nr:5'/3'-nucleotidase SurE [Actinomycetota bacterium]
MSRPTSVLAALAVSAALVLAGCGSSDSDGAADPTTTTAAAEATTTTTVAAEPLQILVSNDDGYQAEGIDVLVEALSGVDGVEVTVVAPLTQQSGTGGKSTEGDLPVTDVELASGHPAKAVEGFPSDAVRVAIDDLGIEPDLVITGINEGQNVGPAVDLSGTVGAARAAVARGVPALATSQGTGATYDYEAAVPLILDWLEEHREAIAAGEEPVAVTNLNVPSCATGEVRGLEEAEADLDGDFGEALAAQDCSSTAAADDLDGDVALLNAGFATIGPVADAPAQPAG